MKQHKQITLPEPITNEGAAPVSFEQFIDAALVQGQVFNANTAGAMAAFRIKSAVDASTNTITLRKEDWRLLEQYLDDPGPGGLPLRPAWRAVAFIEAIKDAVDKE